MHGDAVLAQGVLYGGKIDLRKIASHRSGHAGGFARNGAAGDHAGNIPHGVGYADAAPGREQVFHPPAGKFRQAAFLFLDSVRLSGCPGKS